MGSKNNGRIHKHYKEYFDRPVEYDNQGYKRGICDFGDVYENRSPCKTRFAVTMKNSSLSSFHNRMPQSRNSDEFNRQQESNNNNNQMASEKLAKTSVQDLVRIQRNKTRTKKNSRRSLERLEPDEYLLFWSNS